MTTSSPATGQPHRGTLDAFLAADEIAQLPELSDRDWDTLRRKAGSQQVWRFCTLRNLVAYRGRFTFDAMGFAWGGIYRTLLVSSIVTTSFRNEGHFRAGERIGGTSDFFSGAFAFPRTSAEFAEIVQLVNLRHHVAGVVTPVSDGRVRVVPGYEADYAYVATAFIESIRRGLGLCGLDPASRAGHALAEQTCTILYQLAGFTGLTRVPRDLAAHERFRDAYDRHLRECPPSPRVRRMAQQIAHRIVPYTAFMSGVTARNHIERHIDPETREFLFPAGEIPAELERRRQEWQRRQRRQRTLGDIRGNSLARQALALRPDVAALHRAYHEAVHVNTDDAIDDRLVGAILLHTLDTGRTDGRPLELRSIDLAPGDALIRQGERLGEMYVVLSASAPLVVLHARDGAEPRQLAALAAPTVIGEIGMWRGQPAVATVTTREGNRLDLLVIDAARFEALKEEPGFRAATAAEVQRRLALNSSLVGTLLDDSAARTRSPLLASIAQLFRFLIGDSHVALDAVIGLPDEATPAECVDALRQQVDEAIRAGSLPAELETYLANVVATIG
jgi:CRP-like cAMP-binding protein